MTGQTRSLLDHLVIGAAELEQGISFVRNCLGVEVPSGGRHPKMGTHNRLMRIGDGCFLEIIAVDQTASAPDRPRWFGLDDPHVRQRLARHPVLLTWVVNTPDIHQLLKGAAFSMGRPERITRENLSWRFTLPRDGRLLGAGMLPYAIQWDRSRHPSGSMPDMGCQLVELELHHPCPAWLKSALDSIGAAGLATIRPLPRKEAPFITASFHTAAGRKMLGSHAGHDNR